MFKALILQAQHNLSDAKMEFMIRHRLSWMRLLRFDLCDIARANAAKSSVRARIEHVFAQQKKKFGLFIRTIGSARAEAKLTLANIAYNFDRLIFHERSRARG